jgi:hypothetical protein
MELAKEQQKQIAELTKPKPAESSLKPLRDRLIAKNIKDTDADLMVDAMGEFMADLDARYLPKQYEGAVASAFMESRERSEGETIADKFKLAPEDMRNVRAEYRKVREEVGPNVPVNVALELAAHRAKDKTPKKPAVDPMGKPATPPHTGARPGGKSWDDYTPEEWAKLPEETRDRMLYGA